MARARGTGCAGDATRDAAITPGKTPEGMILQKGDNVIIVDPKTKRRTKGRILADTVVGLPQSAGATIQFKPISSAMKAAPRTVPPH